MEICFAFWKTSCDIIWDAWSAAGTFFAGIVAIGIAYHSYVATGRDQSKKNRVIARHMYSELVRIYNIACWWDDLHRKISSGAIPTDFQPALRLAFYDAENISTPIYDGFHSTITSFSSLLGELILAAYSQVSLAKGRLERYEQQNRLEPNQKNFDTLLPVISGLKNDLYVVLSQLAQELQIDAKTSLAPGPARYTDSAWWTEHT